MISSMTGYGSAKGCIGKLEVSVELRSVNSQFDCSVKMQAVCFCRGEYKGSDSKLRFERKVDVYVNIDSSMADDVTIKLNEPLVEAYIEALKVSEKFGIENDVGCGAERIPDGFIVEKHEIALSCFLRI